MVKESRRLNIPFDLGFLLSELIFKVEQAVISYQRDEVVYRKKQNIRIYFVFETLQELRLGLSQINISGETQADIESYLDQTIMKYGLTPDEELEIDDKKLISKVRFKIRRKRQSEMEFKLEDLEDLSNTLKLWKDRIGIDLGRMEISD